MQAMCVRRRVSSGFCSPRGCSSRGAGWVNVPALLLLLDAHLIEDRFPLLLLAMDVPRQLLRRHRTREATQLGKPLHNIGVGDDVTQILAYLLRDACWRSGRCNQRG